MTFLNLKQFVDYNNLVDLLRYRAVQQPNKKAFTFLVDGENATISITYEALDYQAKTIAARLQKEGLADSRALLIYPPGLDFITAFLGCLYAGVVAIPVYPPRLNKPMPRIQAIVEDAQTQIALTTSEILRNVQKRLEHSHFLSALNWISTDKDLNALPDDWQEIAINHEKVAFLQYTSGSTSSPKGVMVSQGNLLHNLECIRQAFNIAPNDLGVSWLPMYHDMGLIGGVLAPLYVGGSALLMSPFAFMEKPIRWLQAISHYKGTVSGGPNFAYELCVERITDDQSAALDLSDWQTAFCGAEPIRAGTLRRFVHAFAPYGFSQNKFYPCYGLAESTLLVSGGTHSAPPTLRSFNNNKLRTNQVLEVASEDENAYDLVGCGKTYVEQRIVIVDLNGLTPCPEEQIGEIWVSGPSVAKGYWGRLEETEQVFHAYLSNTGDGPYLRTGDLGFVKDGNLFITGRIKDVIILYGRNYYPQDIEYTVSNSHPALQGRSGAAFSVEIAGEERLVIVQEVNRSYLQHLMGNEVFNAIRQAIARDHGLLVYSIALVKPRKLPRTSSGKIQRYKCRTQFLDSSLVAVRKWCVDQQSYQVPIDQFNHTASSPSTLPRVAEADTNQLALAIEKWLVIQIAESANVGIDQIIADQPFDRYGIDSLEATNITLALEIKLTRTLPQTLVWEYPTIRTLSRYLAEETASAKSDLVDVIQRFSMDRASDSFPLQQRKSNLASVPLQSQDSLSRVLSPSFFEQRLDMLNERYYEALSLEHYFYEPIITQYDGAWVISGGQRMLMMASYNYLGLLSHPLVDKAAQKAIIEFGTGTHGVRLLAGTTSLHRQLENRIAQFKGADDAIVFTSGYTTNVATISTLVSKGHVVICDKLNHASIVDGCAMSQAQFMIFRHNDMDDLERCLHQTGQTGKLVVVDAVFSMDGDIANLPEISQLCRRYGAYLMVDEAHSLGVLGETGHGIEEYFGLGNNVIDVKMGTLSKTIPSVGGYVAGTRKLITALKHNARPFIFSAALPPPQTAAAIASFDIIESEPELVSGLQRKVKKYISGLRELGFDTLSSKTPIVPIICHNEEQTFEMTRLCQTSDLFVLPIVYPAVPISSPRLRTTITALHTDLDIDFALDVFAKAGKQCGLI